MLSQRDLARQKYLTDLLRPVGVELSDLSEGASRALTNYARFILDSSVSPSSAWNEAVNEICRAVESEILVSLTKIRGLERLRACNGLGEIARELRRVGSDHTLKQRLSAVGIQLGYISITMPDIIEKLAKIRRDSGAVHGSEQSRGFAELVSFRLDFFSRTAVRPGFCAWRKSRCRPVGVTSSSQLTYSSKPRVGMQRGKMLRVPLL